MKRILCLIDSLGSGGAQRQMTELAKLLHQAGYPVKVVFWIHYENDHFLEDELALNQVDFAYTPSMRKTSTRLFELRKVIKDNRPDVVISYYSGISKLLCVDHLLHRKNYKLIVSERTITRQITRSSKVKHQLYRVADVIVPNSTTESKFIKEHFPFLKDKVIAINNFVDEEKFYPIEKTVGDYENTNAIFVGRYNEAKNIPDFLRAIAKVAQTGRKFHVDFFGRDIAEHCDALVDELGIKDFVAPLSVNRSFWNDSPILGSSSRAFRPDSTPLLLDQYANARPLGGICSNRCHFGRIYVKTVVFYTILKNEKYRKTVTVSDNLFENRQTLFNPLSPQTVLG
ncbi:MAG: glycosyltransferase [Thermoguttaceae bacterium]|nr:glycosyltransferase [Thermoguttaceae bacterium]